MTWEIAFFSLIVLVSLVSLFRPGASIGLVFCMFGIEPLLQSKSIYFINNPTYLNVAIGIVVLVGALASLYHRPLRSSDFNFIQILCISIFLYGFLSYFWTLSPNEFRRWRGAIPYMGIYLVLGPLITRHPTALRDAFKWMLIIGVPVAVLSAFFSDWGFRGMILARPILAGNRFETETLPLGLASMASSLGIVALCFYFKFPVQLPIRLAILSLGIYIAFLTESRGQVVAIIGVAAIIYPISNRATNIKGLFVTMLGLAIFGIIVYYMIQELELIRWKQKHIDRAMIGRQDMWVDLLSQWFYAGFQTVFFGFGINSSFRLIGFYPHNLLIEILVELGLIGFAAYLTVLFRSFLNVLKLLSKLESFPAIRGDVVSLVGLIGVNFALSQKEGSLYGWPVLFFLFICLEQQIPITNQVIRRSGWIRNLFVKAQAPPTADSDSAQPTPNEQPAPFSGRTASN